MLDLSYTIFPPDIQRIIRGKVEYLNRELEIPKRVLEAIDLRFIFEIDYLPEQIINCFLKLDISLQRYKNIYRLELLKRFYSYEELVEIIWRIQTWFIGKSEEVNKRLNDIFKENGCKLRTIEKLSNYETGFVSIIDERRLKISPTYGIFDLTGKFCDSTTIFTDIEDYYNHLLGLNKSKLEIVNIINGIPELRRLKYGTTMFKEYVSLCKIENYFMLA